MIWNIMQYNAFKFQAHGLNFFFSMTTLPMCCSLNEVAMAKCLQFSMLQHSLSAYFLPQQSFSSITHPLK